MMIKTRVKTAMMMRSTIDVCHFCSRLFTMSGLQDKPAQRDERQWILPNKIDSKSTKFNQFCTICTDCSTLITKNPYIEINTNTQYKNPNIKQALFFHKQF